MWTPSLSSPSDPHLPRFLLLCSPFQHAHLPPLHPPKSSISLLPRDHSFRLRAQVAVTDDWKRASGLQTATARLTGLTPPGISPARASTPLSCGLARFLPAGVPRRGTAGRFPPPSGASAAPPSPPGGGKRRRGPPPREGGRRQTRRGRWKSDGARWSSLARWASGPEASRS